ncbi:c-type cytochrome [Caldinitratiruptor microaerophilus]|uniref:Cytochrome c domain-containing protein n=1 Tax=Caldinitratiruptor microaerophilus TaxID=671077 RepID=A0AA35G5F4_9FIRM|nr:cytochrome c [Caldinitratiruptor microaerophilus]BDG59296.1 hypothetical protein caldi_03860 [Caldinitratiruptor microaerophilus]
MEKTKTKLGALFPAGPTRGLAAALLLGLVLPAAGCGGGGGAKAGGDHGAHATSLGGDAARGKQVYMNTCASCHGPNAEGMPGLGKSWVTSEFIASQTDQQLLEFIKKGRPATDPANTTKVDMPPKGGNPALTDEDLINVIAFMRTVNKVNK